uniref:Uncharacterized protein n=1 Tax=Thermosporothrix sp. COM3 TaxID=2490863 RepID=A0A455SJQ2_9CHLR|nr:hypothetical protein KTC_00350 [Thermosporothrix sp. COM3]
MISASVTIQITAESKLMPSWMGKVAAFAQVLTRVDILNAVQERVRFACARCGQYDLIDFVAVLIVYVVSGESTLVAFYERLLPFAEPFTPCLGETSCPIARLCPAFLPLSISPLWKHSASSFKKTWLPVNRLLLQVEWWIEQDSNSRL